MIASEILTLGTSSSILKFEFSDQLQPAQMAVSDLPPRKVRAWQASPGFPACLSQFNYCWPRRRVVASRYFTIASAIEREIVF